MIRATTFKGQTLAIFGLGRSGLSTALSLMKGGAIVKAWDDNPAARQAAKSLNIPLCNLSLSDWSDYCALVLSPGVPDILPKPHWVAQKARKAGVEIICDIEIFARETLDIPDSSKPKIIAITGTNGKSTTTALIGHILKACGRDAQIGGNIGRGVLDLDTMHSGAYYVLELSSYQLERTHSLRANSAVFLNLSPDHLDRHGTLKDYAKAKSRIFHNQEKSDAAIIGVDNPEGQELCTKLMAKNGRSIVPISGRKSLGRGVYVIKGTLYSALGDKTLKIANLSKAKGLEGEHNWQNAAAAFAAVAALGIEPRHIGDAILSFPGLEHRMETIGTVGPVRFVNDSKATNADAAKQALKAYDNIYWIAGGQAKVGGIETLSGLFQNISKAYLIGEAADDFKKTLDAETVLNKISGSLDQAVMCATRDALNSKVENPIVLLSPACASFDQFKSFERRGDAFRMACQKIIDLFESEKNKVREKPLPLKSPVKSPDSKLSNPQRSRSEITHSDTADGLKLSGVQT